MTDLQQRGLEMARMHLEQTQKMEILRVLNRGTIVARSGTEVVFVMVKTRSTTTFGHPLEAMTIAKLSALRSWAGSWMLNNPQPQGTTIRLDVIGVLAPTEGTVSIEHIERVF